MLEPVDGRRSSWSGGPAKPLDFEPGTKWQYSNTNYTIAGLDRRAGGGRPLIDFLQRADLRAGSA